MKMVRTDSTAQTLDRFLVQGNLSNSNKTLLDKQNVVSMNIVSVKKLIYEFESDIDEKLQESFRKHSFVGTLTPEQVLL